MEERHGDQERRRHAREPAAVMAGRALVFLDELDGLLQPLLADRGGGRGRARRRARHDPSPPGEQAPAPPLAPGLPTRRRAAVAHGNLTPFSSRYFFAPGWNGIGEPAVWLERSIFSASLCTATSSGFFSISVLTML